MYSELFIQLQFRKLNQILDDKKLYFSKVKTHVCPPLTHLGHSYPNVLGYRRLEEIVCYTAFSARHWRFMEWGLKENYGSIMLTLFKKRVGGGCSGFMSSFHVLLFCCNALAWVGQGVMVGMVLNQKRRDLY